MTYTWEYILDYVEHPSPHAGLRRTFSSITTSKASKRTQQHSDTPQRQNQPQAHRPLVQDILEGEEESGRDDALGDLGSDTYSFRKNDSCVSEPLLLFYPGQGKKKREAETKKKPTNNKPRQENEKTHPRTSQRIPLPG